MKKLKIWSHIAIAFGLLALGAPDAMAHSGNIIDGVLTQYDVIKHPSMAGVTDPRRTQVITADDGHRIPVEIDAAALPPEGIRGVLNKRVRVTADRGVQSQALDGSVNQRFQARSIQVLSQEDLLPIIGTRKYISLLCKWQGDASEPAPPSFFVNQLNSTNPGFNHYFQELSYGAANITGSTAMGAWVTMPHPEAFYFPPGSTRDGSYLQAMGQDCITAAEATVDFTGVVGVNFMYNGLVDDCCAWGGSAFFNFNEGGNRVVSATWMPYWINFGWLDHGVLAHELAHSFGSPHSNDPSGYQYGNYWDVVSRPGGTCVVDNATYGCVGQHAVANNKLDMGFIAAGRVANHPVGGASTTYNVERMAQPPNAGGTHQMVKVLTAAATKYYTVESRKRVGYDQNVPGDGVLIHEVITNRPHYPPPTFDHPGDPALMLRPDGLTGTFGQAGIGGIGAMWSPGQVYLNNTDNVKITVVAYDAATGTANIKVEPASTPGEYSFVATTSSVAEGTAAAINIAVTRGAPFTAAGSVVWTTSNGTALAGTDFGTLGSGTQKTGSLTWTAGTGGTKNITVGLAASNIPIINDAGVVDGNKTFTVTLSSPVGGVLGAQTTNTVTRVDTDAIISFASGTANVNETGPNTTLTINRTGSTAVAQAVTFTTTNGTAVAPGDYATTAGSITFAIGETSKTIAVGPTLVAAPYIRVLDDALVEGPETFNVTLSAPTNGATLGATPATVVTIASNENGVSMAIAALPGINEGSGAINVVANRAGSAGTVDVNYNFTNGTALNGLNYTGTPGSLHWNDGESGPKNIPVTILEDGAPNTARTFTVTLSGAAGATLVAPLSTSVSIADNDNTVQFAAPTSVVAEGTVNLMLSVTRTGVAVGQAAQVTWTTADGAAFAGTDFGILGNVTPLTGTLNWAAGDLAAKQITIPILNDLLVEGAKTFTVNLSAPTGPNLTIGANPVNTVTLNDNDKGIAFVPPGTYTVTEGLAPNTVTISVARIGPTTTTATATWATVNGTAESGKDFGILNNLAPRTGTLSWAVGDAANKTIVIPILNDTVGGEGAETFTVTLTPGAGYVLGAPGIATVTINDDDIPPQSNVQFSQPKYVVLENGLNAVLTLNRVNVGGGFGLAADVKYSTVAGTALATSDYTTATNVNVHWNAGDNAPKNISIPIVNNTIAEPPESFKVVLSAPTPGLGLGAPNEATVLIIDDDELFPLDGVIPAGFSTPGGVTKGWHVSNDPGAYEGVFALKNDEIDDGETAGLQMSGTFVAGNVTFRVKVSSEPGFDLLTFSVDGVPQPLTWSGTAVTGWTASPTYPLAAGVHTLRWVYSKDATVSVGADAAYIDGLVTPTFTP